MNKKIFLLSVFVFVLLFSGTAVFAQSAPQIQTNSATNIQNTSATLNANLTYLGTSGSTTVYFQWGTSTSYGSQTSGVIQSYIGSFNQSISGIAPNTTFHFRSVAQNGYGTVYGQDMTFTTSQSGNTITANAGPDLYLTSGQTATLQGSGYDPNGYSLNYSWTCSGGSLSNYNVAQPNYTAPYAINGYNQATYTCTLTATNNFGGSASDSMLVYLNSNNNGSGSLSVTKQVINLTSGNLNWATSVAAKPGDILSFAITLQPNNQDIHNVIVTDILPANLIYKGNLLVNAVLNPVGSNLSSGINVGTIPAGGIEVISFQAYVASPANFTYGITTLNNNATITSTEAGSQTATASVLVNNSVIQGATVISTGQTNNPITDSFFLPIMLIILGSWFYFSGKVYVFADWLGTKIN